MINKNKFQVFLDQDDVLADFTGGVCDFFGVSRHLTLMNWDKGCWGDDKALKKHFGCSGVNFWEAIGFPGFWENLSWTEDGRELYHFLRPYKPIIFTSPCQGSADGKMQWIKKNLPDAWKDKRWLIGAGKHYVAGPNRVLIDDSDENIRKWEETGGTGILVPRVWNSKYEVENSIEHIKMTIKTLLGG